MNLQAEPVELHTIKSMRVLSKQPDLSELQLKMSALRSKWLLGDTDSNLTLKAMNLYHHAMEYRNSLSDDIILHVNTHFSEEMKSKDKVTEAPAFAPSPKASSKASTVVTRVTSIPKISAATSLLNLNVNENEQQFSPF